MRGCVFILGAWALLAAGAFGLYALGVPGFLLIPLTGLLLAALIWRGVGIMRGDDARRAAWQHEQTRRRWQWEDDAPRPENYPANDPGLGYLRAMARYGRGNPYPADNQPMPKEYRANHER